MLQAMNTGHDGSLSHGPRQLAARRALAHRDDGPDGRLRPAGQGDPPAGGLGARPDHPPRAPPRRLAQGHRDHRGAAHGVRRDHAAGPVRVQDRGGQRTGNRRDRRAPLDRPAAELPAQVREARDRDPERASSNGNGSPDKRGAPAARGETASNDRAPRGRWRWRSRPRPQPPRPGRLSFRRSQATPSPTAPSRSSCPRGGNWPGAT